MRLTSQCIENWHKIVVSIVMMVNINLVLVEYAWNSFRKEGRRDLSSVGLVVSSGIADRSDNLITTKKHGQQQQYSSS